MTERQRTVALLIDYDNLQICYSRDAPGTQLDLSAVMALAQSYGRVVVARAYAEWNLLSERLAVYKAGLEPAFAPVLRPEGSTREGKSLADTVMVSDGVDLLWTHQPDVLVMVTSDKDMVPLARLAKQRGVLVVVLGSDLTAVPLLEMANEFVTYRHLIRELGRPEEKVLHGRLREEPSARRGRESGYSREVAAAREATLREPRTPPSRSRTRTPAAALSAPPRTEHAALPAVERTVARAGAATLPVAGMSTAAVRPPSETQAEAGEVERIQLDESGQPVAQRRRRRRGGRGRRTGPGTTAGEQVLGEAETLDEPIGEAESQVETASAVTDQDLDVVAEPEAVAENVEEHAESDLVVELPVEPAVSERPTSRRRPPRRAAASLAEPVQEDPTQEPASVATPEPEPPALRPWERWAELPPAPVPNRPSRLIPTPNEVSNARPEVAAPAAEPEPEPVAETAPEVVDVPLAEMPEVGDPAARNGEATSETTSNAAVEGAAEGSSDGTGEAEAAPAPARRRARRTPGRRKPASTATPSESE